MDKWFHPRLYDGCNYLSMLRWKLNYVSKRGHWCLVVFVQFRSSLVGGWHVMLSIVAIRSVVLMNLLFVFQIWSFEPCVILISIVSALALMVLTMDMLWEKFQWILPFYMKPISFQSKASVVCSVTTAVFIGFAWKKLNVVYQHIGKKMNIWILQSKSSGIEMLIDFLC